MQIAILEMHSRVDCVLPWCRPIFSLFEIGAELGVINNHVGLSCMQHGCQAY